MNNYEFNIGGPIEDFKTNLRQLSNKIYKITASLELADIRLGDLHRDFKEQNNLDDDSTVRELNNLTIEELTEIVKKYGMQKLNKNDFLNKAGLIDNGSVIDIQGSRYTKNTPVFTNKKSHTKSKKRKK